MQPRAPIYHYYTDNLIPDSTLRIETGTDTGDSDYAASKLGDLDPAELAKINSSTAAWVANLGSPQPLSDMQLVHHTVGEAVPVLFQAHDSDSWGSPLVSLPVTAPAWLGSGVGRWPQNLNLMIADILGEVPVLQYVRLLVTGNDQFVWAGQWVVNKATRRMADGWSWQSNFKRTIRSRVIENETAYGVKTIMSRGTKEVSFEAVHRMRGDDQDDMTAHFYDTEGKVYPWSLLPYGSADPRNYFGRWSSDSRADEQFAPGGWEHKFVFEEAARGLRPGV